ncbi:potassium channel family protein [Edwardsiella tarda]|uniref:potassium channel family protein n=1 Tax=Edwardsiella tarda TaxID=636 RepID=UPI00098E9A99|nr:potassium channel family protein [Edwardsiella tarda]
MHGTKPQRHHIPLRVKAEQHQFGWLFASLIGVFFINLIPNIGDLQIKSLICLTLQGIAGFNVVLRRYRKFVTVPIIVNIVIFLFFPHSVPFVVLGKMLYLYFFTLVTIAVVRKVILATRVDIEVLLAALSGFLLIGYIGLFIFSSIEVLHPGSFKGIGGDQQQMFNDLFYYSFISILTVGYGDIVAVSWPARNATILVVLLGYIYSLVFIARIVSDFPKLAPLCGKEEEEEKEANADTEVLPQNKRARRARRRKH